MFKQLLGRFAMVTALVTGMGFLAPAAAMAAGSGPGDALAPSGSSERLNIGQSRWYVFTTAGDGEGDNPSNVLVTLQTQPDGSAGFNIWSDERLRERAASDEPDEDAPPVGKGAKVEITNSDDQVTEVLFNNALAWTANFNTPQTFYVEVYQTGPQASEYLLSITGDAVSFPTAPAQPEQAEAAPRSTAATQPEQTEAASMDASMPAASASSGGTGTDNALAPSGSSERLNIGQSRWYVFTTAGDGEGDNPSNVLVTLQTQPDGSAGFNIWSDERLMERAASDEPDEDAPPVGRGAKAEMTNSEGEVTEVLFDHALVWAAGFDTPQTFYVEVYQTGPQAGDYLLSITGDAVSFP